MKIPTDQIQIASQTFEDAVLKIEKISEELKEAVDNLCSEWEDGNQQHFFRHFQVWDEHSGGYSEGLKLIAGELLAIAQRYQQADAENPVRKPDFQDQNNVEQSGFIM